MDVDRAKITTATKRRGAADGEPIFATPVPAFLKHELTPFSVGHPDQTYFLLECEGTMQSYIHGD